MEADWNITNSTNAWNATTSDWEVLPEWKQILSTVQQVVLTAILVVIMVAMGCNITLQEVWEHLKRPVGFAIGLVGQFVFLPLLAFGAAIVLSFEQEHAIGLLLLCTCPGGSFSNILTYWVDGDISLSVSMTTVSTLVSFGMMPLNLWLYSRWWAVGGAKIPYIRIVISLVTILGSAGTGMLIRWRSQKAAKWITTIGSVSGLAGIVTSISITMALFPSLLQVSWRVTIVGFLLPPLAFITSYAVAFACRREQRICRTIGIETTIQNIPMVSSIITLSFAPELAAKMLTPTMLYGPVMVTEGCLCCGMFRLARRMTKNYQVNPQSGLDAKDVMAVYKVEIVPMQECHPESK